MQNIPKSTENTSFLTMLERVVDESCHCKLREKCLDKASQDCLKHHHLYAEYMLSRRDTKRQ